MSLPNDRYLSFKLLSKSSAADLLSSLNRAQERGLINAENIYLNLYTKNISTPKRTNFLEVDTQITIEKLLLGLNQWQETGILNDAQINLEIQTPANHPFLLESLDEWLRLGFIDEYKIKQLCRENLTSTLPAVKVSPVSAVAEQKKLVQVPAQPKPPSRFTQILQSLKAELSVVWLLLLGVFTIVISSGVIAANLWTVFPKTGQYGILWVYTLLFWVGSLWLEKKPNLRLTTIALQLVTILLVPINFLAMDSLGLWQNPLDWLIVALAAVSLSFVTVKLFDKLELQNRYFKIHLGLSYLHWGWAMVWYPLWAIYLGVIGTAIIILFSSSTGNKIASISTNEKQSKLPFNLHGTIVTYALAVLIIRGIVIAQIPVNQLSLAVGICGWLLTRARKTYFPWWQSVGVILLGLGWLLSVVSLPWQAFAVSCLGILYLRKRLVRSWLERDFCLLLLIGLQSLWLLWRLIPETIGQQLVVFATTLTASENTPEALLSIALFPYLAVILATNEWLVRKNKQQLANLGNKIAFLFGLVLTVFSLINPALRTINLVLSTVTLIIFIQRKLTRISDRESVTQSREDVVISPILATFTHVCGLITIIFAIDWILPQLSIGGWAIIFLLLAITELVISVVVPVTSIEIIRILSKDAWYIGLSLTGICFTFFWINQQAILENQTFLSGRSPIELEWGLLWCTIPITLTIVAFKYTSRRRIANQLSFVTLLAWQLLTLTELISYFLGREITLNIPVYSASLGIATIVALVNTSKVRKLIFASISIGFGLSWLILHLWAGIFGWRLQSIGGWCLVGAIVVTIFWLSRHRLKKVDSSLAVIYTQACNRWAIFLNSIICLLLVVNIFANNFKPLDLLSSIATAILILATAYNSSQKPRSSFDVWLGIATVLSLQIPMLSLPGYRLISLGIATGLTLVYVNYLPRLVTAIINVGVTIVFVIVSVGEAGLLENFDRGLLLFASIVTILWLLKSRFQLSDGRITNLYNKACDRWGIFFCSLQLLLLTLYSLVIYWDSNSSTVVSVIASAITLFAISYRVWQTPTNVGIYTIGWCLEILTIVTLGLFGYSIVALSIANIILGLVTQVVGNWWYKRHHNSRVFASWNLIPLFYAGLGGVLRWGIFNGLTGLTSLGLAFVFVGVGCRAKKLKPLLYIGIGSITLSAYELLLSRISNLPVGDRFLAMAALTTSFVYGYRVLTPWLSRYWQLTARELKLFASLHWGLATCLLCLGALYPVEVNDFVGLGAGIFLTRYAIYQGRNHPHQQSGESWVYGGIALAGAISLYISTFVDTTFFYRYFAPWSGILASFIAVGLYLLPWQSWGWSKKPWQVTAVAIPLVSIVIYGEVVNDLSLIAVALFYGWLGWQTKQTRWYLLTLLVIDWLIIDWLKTFNLATPFVYMALLGLSIVFVSWLEPKCRGSNRQSTRHYLRLLGMGIICGTSLLFHYETGIIPAVVGLVAIFMGLGLRVKAFLYLGTLTFVFNIFYQLVILIFDYPLLKWVVGLILGLTLLSIAGSFETRKSQLSTLLQNWLAQLQTWE